MNYKVALVFFLLISLTTASWALQGVQDDQNYGFRSLSTATVSLPATSKTDIGTFIPLNAVGFQISVFGGDVIANSSENLATGTFYVGVKIASGTSMTWRGKQTGRPPVIYLAPNSTNPATATITVW